MKLVVKIGGSLCVGSKGPKPDYFSKIFPVLRKIDEENELSVGVGGGDLVRDYGDVVSAFDLTDSEREMCFIQLIKANVKFVSSILGKEPLYSLEGYGGGEVVVGGIEPGRSTDANAAIVAREMDADLLVILTDVDGIYEEDPNHNERAERLDYITFEELDELRGETSPLEYGVVDPTALGIIEENRMKTAVIDGSEPRNVLRLLEDADLGTTIGPGRS